MSWVVAIPSYGRADVLQNKTLPLLLKHKVPASKINIFVADKEEYSIYKEALPEATYNEIIVGKKGISYQRNYIIDHYPEGKEIVFIDDDITQILRKRGGKVGQIQDLSNFFTRSFKALRDNNIFLWATKNQYNAFYKKQLKEEGHIGLIDFSGDLMGIINRKKMKIRITLEKGEAEQQELLFHYTKEDGGILRFENVVVITAKLSPGGKVKERGSVEARKKDLLPNLNALAKAFPEYVEKVITSPAEGRTRGKLQHKDILVKTVEGGAEKRYNVEGKEDTSRSVLSIRNPAKYKEARDELLDILRNTTLPGKLGKPGVGEVYNRARKLGSIGRTITFGYGDTRHGIKDYSSNRKYPELFHALAKFGNQVVPKGWDYNGITLNEGVKANKHKDSKNLGVSYIIGIGDFTGGGIKVWDGDDRDPKVFDLHDKPVVFNGGLLYHQTTPFKGERYTMIFYRQMWKGKPKGVTMEGKGEDDDEMDTGGIFA